MYEVLIAGGPSDGRIIGEFKDLVDAYDMVTAFDDPKDRAKIATFLDREFGGDGNV